MPVILDDDSFCENCAHWQPDNSTLRAHGCVIGECRRRAPFISPQHVEDCGSVSRLLTGAWPITHQHGFCGDFVPCPPEGRP